ncbi:MAG: riboflavin biosynthesis protein RibF [Duncaniella sp.]|nr:riboflavin biosynthesis protein RibF [Duncaniella sp.]
MELISKSDARPAKGRIAAVGMWDGVHLGHRFLIDYVKIEGTYRDLIPSVITFDTHPLSVVRPQDMPPLLNTAEERLERLGKAGVEHCILLEFDDRTRHMSAREFLTSLKHDYAVDTLVVGFNNRFGHDRVDGIEQYREIASAIGMTVIEAPEYSGDHAPISSSVIRKLLAEGKVADAALRLGYDYAIKGVVVNGEHIGRTIGFPTANIVPVSEHSLIPRPGVYAVKVTMPDGTERPGMVNIGTRPTVTDGNDAETTIEVHILDYNGFLYEEELTLHFVERLRGEKKFASLKKLTSALEADAVKVRKLLAQPR